MGRRGSNHKILFRHSLTGGNWVLIVDGRWVLRFLILLHCFTFYFSRRVEVAGYEPVTNAEFTISFKLGNENAHISCVMETSVFNYQHRFFINTIEQTPFRAQLESSFNESLPTQITVPSHIARLDGNKYAIYYQIDVVSADGSVHSVYHRYSAFDLLDLSMRSLLDGHLKSSLPSLPGKVFNPFFNQMAEKFLNDRQQHLQQYLQILLGNSKAVYTTDFLCFLGLDPLSGFPISRIHH